MLAMISLAALAKTFATPALAQPFPEPSAASQQSAVIKAAISDEVARVEPPNTDATNADEQCPTDVRSITRGLRLAGFGANATNYALYTILDECAESLE